MLLLAVQADRSIKHALLDPLICIQICQSVPCIITIDCLPHVQGINHQT